MPNGRVPAPAARYAGVKGVSAPSRIGGGQGREDKPFLSPYLCPWCRNGRSLNEAHENCLAGGKFDRFWPVDDVSVEDVREIPVREMASGKLTPYEIRVIVYFYLWLTSRTHSGGQRSRSNASGGFRQERGNGQKEE